MPDVLLQFVWFCASGDSFFLGAALMVLAAVMPMVRAIQVPALLMRVLLIVGLVLLVLGTVPLSPPFHLALAASGVLSFIAARPRAKHIKVYRAGQACVLILCIAGGAMECGFRMGVGQPRTSSLWVIGDSVSAGMQGPNEVTWPELLSAKYGIEVVNLAVPGAPVASAAKQARRIGADAQLVLLEIGGNDSFDPTSDRLCRSVNVSRSIR